MAAAGLKGDGANQGFDLQVGEGGGVAEVKVPAQGGPLHSLSLITHCISRSGR